MQRVPLVRCPRSWSGSVRRPGRFSTRTSESVPCPVAVPAARSALTADGGRVEDGPVVAALSVDHVVARSAVDRCLSEDRAGQAVAPAAPDEALDPVERVGPVTGGHAVVRLPTTGVVTSA